MQFKHPELLYALFLLLIPIFIHLFQLRRFQKVDFTNVSFLKKVTLQTRKSSQLKKWLTLLVRMLALSCLIFAFAQPFTASKSALSLDKETVIYIDNSFSMQIKGAHGPLLERALQDLYEQLDADGKLSWFTNNMDRKNVSSQEFKSEILTVGYSQNQLSPTEVMLKANRFFSNNKGSEKRLIYISDFQLKSTFPQIEEGLIVDAIPMRPIITTNAFIDSAYIVSKSPGQVKLNVKLSSFGAISQSLPISLYNNGVLLAKSGINFTTNNSSSLSFDIDTGNGIKGRFEIQESNLTFDNTLFFSINSPKRINVLSLNERPSNYLQRLFDRQEFNYTEQDYSSINYNSIPDQNFIILNELKDIPTSLIKTLNVFTDNGGSIMVIPSEESTLSDYNSLLSSFSMGTFLERVEQERKITNIEFDHPLYNDVFEKKVVNFQYPKVNSFYNLESDASPILNFENGDPFIIQYGSFYLCTAPINSTNSNFQNSPLIVPTFYNMAQQSLRLPKLYYTIGQENTFSVPIRLIQDEILEMRDSLSSFIPIQQMKPNKIDITTQDAPSVSGTYQIVKKEQFVENISYNYSRDESRLLYANPVDWQGATAHTSLDELFETINEINSINSFWKWFAIFALVFLLLEMLILKYYK